MKNFKREQMTVIEEKKNQINLIWERIDRYRIKIEKNIDKINSLNLLNEDEKDKIESLEEMNTVYQKTVNNYRELIERIKNG